MTRQIVVRFQRAGFHCWPNASGERAYLASRHRHLFKVEVRIDVAHDDREVEFHDLLDVVRDTWPDDFDFGSQSCEQIAALVALRAQSAYPARTIGVCIFEDGENGAQLWWDADEVIGQ